MGMRYLIKMAYRVRDFQILGGPGWLSSGRFNITSKAEGNPSEDQVRLRAQILLANCLTYSYSGMNTRLTSVHGNVVRKVMA
jgi:uncharacterized protein (TIGR03435 family)